MSLFLTSDELSELTGLLVPAYQRRWLEKHGYPYETNASGKPKVLRIYLLQKLGVMQPIIESSSPEPNFDAIT